MATNLLGAMAVILMRAPSSTGDGDNPVRVCQCIPMVPGRQAFERRFGMQLVTGYVQTKAGSCGRAHPDWGVAIVDTADRPLPPRTVGEIVSRPKKSWSMFSGYYRAEAKTVETLRNLWHHSGDASVMDEDGWLYFKHRLNEAIRRRGENVSAYEVENLAEKHPDIVKSAAFGVPSEFTEEDIMIVALRRAGSTLAPADLLRHFTECAPPHGPALYRDHRQPAAENVDGKGRQEHLAATGRRRSHLRPWSALENAFSPRDESSPSLRFLSGSDRKTAMRCCWNARRLRFAAGRARRAPPGADRQASSRAIGGLKARPGLPDMPVAPGMRKGYEKAGIRPRGE